MKRNAGRAAVAVSLSLLGVYANTEKSSCACAVKKSSQRDDVIAAIAAKDAAAASAAVAAIRESVRPGAVQSNKKVNPTAKKRAEFCEPVQPADGER